MSAAGQPLAFCLGGSLNTKHSGIMTSVCSTTSSPPRGESMALRPARCSWLRQQALFTTPATYGMTLYLLHQKRLGVLSWTMGQFRVKPKSRVDSGFIGGG